MFRKAKGYAIQGKWKNPWVKGERLENYAETWVSQNVEEDWREFGFGFGFGYGSVGFDIQQGYVYR